MDLLAETIEFLRKALKFFPFSADRGLEVYTKFGMLTAEGSCVAFQVVGKETLDKARISLQGAAPAIDRWLTLIEHCTANHFMELKNTFSAVDNVPPHTVFDLGGNKWRLIALINYVSRVVFVKTVLMHAEYDKGKWKE